MKIMNYMVVLCCLVFMVGCNDSGSGSASTGTGATSPGEFTIVSNAGNAFSKTFDRKVEVFGIPIYAVPGVADDRLLHAANIMAQYLDNDEDGVADNSQVLSEMQGAGALLAMWKTESDLAAFDVPAGTTAQDLGNDETRPEWHTNGHTGEFDAALEEVWHLITHAGYAKAYPSVFGEDAGSLLADAMDTARGGQFGSVPSTYPAGAWFTYDDVTCDYPCMATEYFYWAMTSVLGAQEKRAGEIAHEWALNTRTLVESRDKAVYDLLTDSQYSLPTTLPDGTYRR